MREEEEYNDSIQSGEVVSDSGLVVVQAISAQQGSVDLKALVLRIKVNRFLQLNQRGIMLSIARA